MSKFNNIMESKLDTTDLLRVRVKYDPANEETDPDQVKDYVGYILKEEEHGGVVAIVPALGPEPMTLDIDQYEPMESPCDMQQDSLLIKFKQHVINYLLQKGFQKEVGRYMEDIIRSNDTEPLEKMLSKCGCGPEEILNTYRDFVNDVKF